MHIILLGIRFSLVLLSDCRRVFLNFSLFYGFDPHGNILRCTDECSMQCGYEFVDVKKVILWAFDYPASTESEE